MKLRGLIAERFNLDAKAGGWQEINCPFHGDENASAGINFRLNMFNCLAGCNARPLDQFAADLKVWKRLPKSKRTSPSNSLKPSQSVKTHTVKKQTVQLLDFLDSRKLRMRTVSKLGGELILDTTDPLYGYLAFPFEGGRVGRKILDVSFFDKKRGREVPAPRFLTFIGNKSVSQNLKGLIGMDAIPKYHDLILAEGLSDWITLRELGYANSICSLGAGISDYQGYLLRNRTVFILYDRDYTGIKKARNAQSRLREWQTNSIILELPSRFGGEIGKIDISSAYVSHDKELKEWLDAEIAKYSDSDTGFVEQFRLAKELEYLPTGLETLDDALGGGFTQGLYAIGGETSAGKSTFAIVIARAFARMNKRVVLFTYELPKRQVWARYAAGFSNHSFVEIERNPGVMELDVIAQLQQDSNCLKIASDGTTEEMKARMRHYEIIIVDYLQRMPRGDKDVNNAIRLNNEFLSAQSMEGKTVIALSSLPRASYGKEDEFLAKGSGDIEYSTQANIKLTKAGENRMHVQFTKNTRGKQSWRGFLDVDWQHQRLRESGYDYE